MSLPNLKGWQWVVIGLALGVVVGLLRQFANDLGVADYGETINGRIDFERALVREVPLADGSTVRALSGLTVYPERLAGDGGIRPVYVVEGWFIGRGKTNAQSGQVEAKVERRCFVADAGPYRSQADGRQFPSVMAYLDSLKPQGVGYTYAWWNDGRWTLPVWSGAGLLVVGLALPALLNLLAYGSLRAPREAEADVDTRPARAAPSAEIAPPEGLADEIESYNEDLEGQLAGRHAAGAAAAPSAAAGAPVKQLRNEAVAAAPVEAGPGKEFGATKDDFYPTERHPGPRRKT
jgi:hypothetical protein